MDDQAKGIKVFPGAQRPRRCLREGMEEVWNYQDSSRVRKGLRVGEVTEMAKSKFSAEIRIPCQMDEPLRSTP